MSNYAVKFPVYQIDFAATAAGKRVASTKRRIRWRFGFPNGQALEAGRTGTDCRGEEHDVIVIWSITSGKRQVSMDGKEIHYSSSRAGQLDFSWTTKGNHVIKVSCHAAAPMSPIPGFRQYDLFIDGQSFFTMPKVYEMGVKGGAPPRGMGRGYSNPTSPISMDSGYPRSVGGPVSRHQEDADLRRAIEASIEESKRHLESRGPGRGTASQQSAPTSDLLDFASPAPSGPPQQPHSDARSVSGMSYYSAPPSYSQQPLPQHAPPAYASPPPYQPAPQPGALVPSHGPPGSYYGAQPTTPSYASPPPVPPAPAPTPQTAYAPPPPAHYNAAAHQPNGDIFGLNAMPGADPFAPRPPPPPSANDYTNAILNAYQSPAPTTPMSGGGSFQQNGSPQTPQANGQPMSMHVLANTAANEAPINDFEKALKNLVNVDHIDEPAEGDMKLTMIQKEKAKKKQPKGKSVPLPPVASRLVGTNASLSQIRGTNHGERTLNQTTDGVMNAPPPGVFAPGAAAGGALVVHGQGPPPLHQASGFGLGARMPNGGFAQQQQQVPMGYQPQQQYR